MRRIVPWLAVVGFSVPLVGQDSIHFVPADRVAVRVMREVPSIDVAPGVHVRTVVGSTGSSSLLATSTPVALPHGIITPGSRRMSASRECST